MQYMYLGHVPVTIHDVTFAKAGEIYEVPFEIVNKNFIKVDEKPSPKRRTRTRKSQNREQPSIEVTDAANDLTDQQPDINVKESE